jgi:hypothetical protein
MNIRMALWVIPPFLFGAPLLAQTGPSGSKEGASEPGPAAPEKAKGDYAKLEEKIKILEEKLAALEKKSKEAEIEGIQKAAEKYGQGEEEESQPKSFLSGARALQAQNPEISLTGDFLGRLYINDDFRKPYPPAPGEEDLEHAASNLSGFDLRAVELNIQSNLDPYSFAKAVICFGAEGVDVEEGYLTWPGLLPRLTLTVGRFKQQFGVINRWHEHALDQVDFPKSIQLFFGEEGLAQTGFSAKLLLPRMWAHANELTIEVTNAENGSLFAGEFWSVPSVLGHLKNYYDLSKSTYLELGLSGLWGFNNRRSFLVQDETTGEYGVQDEPWRSTVVSGVDLTVAWVPPSLSKYRWFIWRTEGMYLWRETPEGVIHAFTGFTYFDFRINQIFVIGARVDAGQKPQIEDDREYVQASPYLTAWLSEWVFLRLQYNYLWNRGKEEPEHLVLLQVDFSVGPHKHEKY